MEPEHEAELLPLDYLGSIMNQREPQLVNKDIDGVPLSLGGQKNSISLEYMESHIMGPQISSSQAAELSLNYPDVLSQYGPDGYSDMDSFYQGMIDHTMDQDYLNDSVAEESFVSFADVAPGVSILGLASFNRDTEDTGCSSAASMIEDNMVWDPDPTPRGRSSRRRKFRGGLSSSARRQMAMIRQIPDCVRCRIQKIRCIPDPEDVNGTCMSCSRISHSMLNVMPCSRVRLNDTVLSWAAKTPSMNVLHMARNSTSFRQYIAESSTDYVKVFMKDKDNITRAVFSLACGQWGPKTESLVQSSLRLWTITRLTEGILPSQSPMKHGGHDSTQPKTILMSDNDDTSTGCSALEEEILELVSQSRKQLHVLHLSNARGNWLAMFITSYVLLHNLEVIIRRERESARRVGHQLCYPDMNIINGCHQSSKAILAYFHYSCEGKDRFVDANLTAEMLRLSVKERAFMSYLSAELLTKRDKLVAVSDSHEYDQEFWLIGQLFDTKWSPRTTLDVALPQTLR